MTAVCAYCQKEDRRLTILHDSASVDQAILDLETNDITHGICRPHRDREMAKVRALPDARVAR